MRVGWPWGALSRQRLPDFAREEGSRFVSCALNKEAELYKNSVRPSKELIISQSTRGAKAKSCTLNIIAAVSVIYMRYILQI